MTDEQFAERIAREMGDVNDTADFYKWSYRRQTEKLPSSHEHWIEAKNAALAVSAASEAEARGRRMASLQADREAERRRYDAEIEASLAEDKTRLQNEWLANNPTLTAEDFERRTWGLLKANLIQERENAQMRIELQAARASMDFG
jgi:hypothetical protein